MAAKQKKRDTFDVGGLAYERPFRIRRLGHFGFNVRDMPAATHFYCDVLGFSISDLLDFGRRVENPEERKALGDTVGLFTRHGTDHHSFVIFPKQVLNKFAGRPDDSDMTINQITWQVGSLREVVDATMWFKDNDVRFLPIRLSPTPTICSVSPWTAGKGRRRRIEEAIRLILDCSENRTGV